eukprot:COSAG04_NODE_137_length_23739_cov_18.665764_3_plen_459_part_00
MKKEKEFPFPPSLGVVAAECGACVGSCEGSPSSGTGGTTTAVARSWWTAWRSERGARGSLAQTNAHRALFCSRCARPLARPNSPPPASPAQPAAAGTTRQRPASQRTPFAARRDGQAEPATCDQPQILSATHSRTNRSSKLQPNSSCSPPPPPNSPGPHPPRRCPAAAPIMLPLAAALALAAAAPQQPARSPYGGRAGPTFNLTLFGAKGDNATLNTKAFEAAVARVEAAGGGTLVVPRGAFRTGPFNLTSHMTLFLDAGAAIYGPTFAQLGEGPAFSMWPIIPAMPSYGQGRDHPGPRRTALIGGGGLTDVVVTAAEDAWVRLPHPTGPHPSHSPHHPLRHLPLLALHVHVLTAVPLAAEFLWVGLRARSTAPARHGGPATASLSSQPPPPPPPTTTTRWWTTPTRTGWAGVATSGRGSSRARGASLSPAATSSSSCAHPQPTARRPPCCRCPTPQR